jgi:predicted metal-binding membrane protein
MASRSLTVESPLPTVANTSARPAPDASSQRRGRRLVVLSTVLVLLSWIAFSVWGRSPHANFHGDDVGGGWRSSMLFVAAWAVMVAAMMLPTATALFRAFGKVTAARAGAAVLHVLVAVGFLGVWVAVGWLFRAGDVVVVHTAVAKIDWLGARPHLVGAALLVVAGLFQFSALKYRCLAKCRSPRGFLIRLWSGRAPHIDALRIGASYGRSCAGCCWALMLVMFGLGAANPAWMVALGSVMALEKNAPRTRPLSHAVGTALVLVGLAVAIAPEAGTLINN